jgi:DNA topoisomerase I
VEGSFKPTELGLLVTDELVRTFPREMDVAFTAGIEEKLDEIEEGKVQWQAVLTDFYAGFKEELEKAQVPAKAQLPAKAQSPAKAQVSTRDVERPVAAAELSCEKCGKTMAVKWGRTGEFLACSGYPDCRNTKSFERAEDGSIQPVKEEEIQTDEACEKCGAPMAVRRGRFGRFLACTKYPACKHSKPISIGVTCPNGCGGYISERLSKRGKTFYGCSSYPKCDFVTWDRPRNEACPTCGSTYLLEKFSKKTGPFIACPHKECGYERQAGGASPLAEGEVPPRTVIDV